jgi:hypothetical protein
MVKRAFLLFTTEQSRVLILGLAIFSIVWARRVIPGWRAAGVPVRNVLVAAALLAVANAFAVVKPKDIFPHYLIFLIQPITLLAGCVLVIVTAGFPKPAGRKLAMVTFVSCMFGLMLPDMSYKLWKTREVWLMREKKDLRIANEIDRVAPGARSMAIWGWMPSLHVQTGIAPATRHAISHYLIEPGPSQSHLRGSFMADIRREKPDLIVDAVADGCFTCGGWWDSTKRLDSFPDFGDHVQRNYVLASEQNLGKADMPVRFYLSREYLAARGRTLQP